MHLADIPPTLRELFGWRTLLREPEPSAIMDDAEQIGVYTRCGQGSGVFAGSYVWQLAGISQVLVGRHRVLDLGCASAVQLCQVAALNHHISFTGVDLSPGMIAEGQRNVVASAVGNVVLEMADMTKLPFADGSFDAVISTLAFHHLPSAEALGLALAEASRVLAPGGAIYIADFIRPKSRATAEYLSRRGRTKPPELLRRDYLNSLCAAFTVTEWKRAHGKLLPQARLISMAPSPVMAVLCSRLHPIPESVAHGISRMIATLDSDGLEAVSDLGLGFAWSPGGRDLFRPQTCR